LIALLARNKDSFGNWDGKPFELAHLPVMETIQNEILLELMRLSLWIGAADIFRFPEINDVVLGHFSAAARHFPATRIYPPTQESITAVTACGRMAGLLVCKLY
jgi:hypothetical protein